MPANPTLKISLLPIDISQGEWQANIETAYRGFDALPAGSDIVVLPELFSTGFIRSHDKAADIASAAWGKSVDALTRLAADRNCAVAGSMMHLDEGSGKIFNRAFFITPDGNLWHYDKRHLFGLGAESEVFSAGEKASPIISFRGWNIALAVCYDMRFPAWIRNTGLKYDLLLVPANWPEARSFAWRHLLQARAIENQAYVAGANRSGEDRMGCYTGQSHICDFTGKMIERDNCFMVDSELSMESLRKFREDFPFWKDADDIQILN